MAKGNRSNETSLPWAAKEQELTTLREQIACLEAEIDEEAKLERRRAAAAARAEQRRAAKAAAAAKSNVVPEETRPAAAQSTPTAPVANLSVTQETWPTGTDLAEPKTFGLKPPFADLDQPTAGSPEEYRRLLGQHLAFATRVLHTSGVVAVVWREWRAFEKALETKLRSLNAVPVTLL